MQEKTSLAKTNNTMWANCPHCGHKLFKVLNESGVCIEIKCPSCKKILGIKSQLHINIKE